MGVYAVTGAASGMGKAISERLAADGHRVIAVDIQATGLADSVVADLSTPAGRAHATQAVLEAAGGVLDGTVMAAGLGPVPDPKKLPLIANVNYLGAVELLTGWRDALAAGAGAKVVVIGSNSTTTMPAVPAVTVRAFLAGRTDRAVATTKIFGKNAAAFVYGASKIALTRWVRRTAVRSDWAGAGIRMNVLAPGAILTPLLEKQLSTPAEAKAVESFPVPVGGYGRPADIAAWTAMLLSDAADFMCGSVVFVDGGSDAYFRPDDWPKPVPVRKIVGYLRRFRGFSRS